MSRRIQDISKPAASRATPATAVKKTAASSRQRSSASRKSEPAAGKRSRSTAARRTARTPRVEVAQSRSGRGAPVLWGVAFILLLVLGYVASMSWAKADIRITLKQQRLAIEETLSIFQDTAEGQLDYDTVAFEREVSEVFEVTASEQVAEKASGMIVVYNAHQTTPQRLIEETRFRATNGLVYKTGVGTTTIVPGYTINEGEVVPGSVSVRIYASEPGEEYNQSETDFVIPGFEGTPKFDNFYARSETPLQGGFIGERPVTSEEEMDTIKGDLESRVRAGVNEEASYRIPEGYMVIPEALRLEGQQFTFVPVEQGFAATMSGVATALLVDRAELTRELLARQESFAAVEELDSLSIVNLSDLDFEIEEVSDNEVQLTVRGDILVRWGAEERAIQQQVAGVRKRDFQAALSSMEAVQSADASLRPNWVFRFPADLDQISVLYQNIDR